MTDELKDYRLRERLDNAARAANTPNEEYHRIGIVMFPNGAVKQLRDVPNGYEIFLKWKKAWQKEYEELLKERNQ